MKVIFLDFDGVLNNWYDHFDGGIALSNVLILKKIIEKTDAKIVVTSSNKYSFQRYGRDYYESFYYNAYAKVLSELGIEIYDITPYVNGDRTLEIIEFINSHDVSEYVVVDDELVGEELQEHQVYLELYKGLQIEHIEPILNILKGKLGFYPQGIDRNETPEERNSRINQYYNDIEAKKGLI